MYERQRECFYAMKMCSTLLLLSLPRGKCVYVCMYMCVCICVDSYFIVWVFLCSLVHLLFLPLIFPIHQPLATIHTPQYTSKHMDRYVETFFFVYKKKLSVISMVLTKYVHRAYHKIDEGKITIQITLT